MPLQLAFMDTTDGVSTARAMLVFSTRLVMLGRCERLGGAGQGVHPAEQRATMPEGIPSRMVAAAMATREPKCWRSLWALQARVGHAVGG